MNSTKTSETLNKINDENSDAVLIFKIYNFDLDYLDLWKESFDGVPCFIWIIYFLYWKWDLLRRISVFQHLNFS